jgi:hypothetical protein
VVKIPLPSGRIQQKTTSKLALIGLAAATIMIAASMIGAIQLQEASAAKPQFCYTNSPGGITCRDSMQACRNEQENDPTAGSRCHPTTAA